MIRIAVAEDDLDWARQLEGYVARYAGENNLSLEFTHYADGEELWQTLTAGAVSTAAAE